ncbi:MAG: HD domain-containing protein [Fimbriimonadia bacterium]|nr:HD domain-containing protein [Fimbriimonadia bacterium]
MRLERHIDVSSGRERFLQKEIDTVLNSDIRRLENDVLRAFIAALEQAHPQMRGHSERVASYAVATAQALGLNAAFLRQVRIAAALHDVGLLVVPTWGGGALSPEQWQAVRKHPETGAQMVSRIQRFQTPSEWILAHHERWDGNGYPKGLAGAAIPLGARILAVAEAFDSMTCFDFYKTPLSEAQALEEIKAHAGTQFDPEVAAAFLRIQPIIQPPPASELTPLSSRN